MCATWRFFVQATHAGFVLLLDFFPRTPQVWATWRPRHARQSPPRDVHLDSSPQNAGNGGGPSGSGGGGDRGKPFG